MNSFKGDEGLLTADDMMFGNKPDTEGPFMPKIIPDDELFGTQWEAFPAESMKQVRAILDEFDYADPSSRFNKDTVMGRVNRIKAILEGK